MDFLRDPLWQSVGAVTAILALLLYIYVERIKISRLFTEALLQLKNLVGNFGHATSTVIVLLFKNYTNREDYWVCPA